MSQKQAKSIFLKRILLTIQQDVFAHTPNNVTTNPLDMTRTYETQLTEQTEETIKKEAPLDKFKSNAICTLRMHIKEHEQT